MTIVVVFAVLLVIGSAYTTRAVDSTNGSMAPMFRIERQDSVVTLDQLKGQWVLLTFWSSSDADSRIACNRYSRISQTLTLNDETNISFRHIAINTDRSQKLFQEIVKHDRLDAKSQFHVAESRANQLQRDYNLLSGMHSFLIAPNGKIVAKNPTEEHLTQLTASF